MKMVKLFLFIIFTILLGACGGDDSSGGATTFVPCIECKTFVIAGTTDGDLLAGGSRINGNITTGPAGADVLCMDDFEFPGMGIYKALIVDGVNRIASITANAGDGQVDWVLKPNTNYYRADGTTLVMTTGANALMLFAQHGGSDLENAFIPNAFNYWTGLKSDWLISSDTCGAWNSNQNTDIGRMGLGGNQTFVAIDSSSTTCDVSRKLLCIEQ